MAKTNRPELDELTDQQRAAVLDGADALDELSDFKRRTFDKWMTVARGIAPLCQLADRPGTSRKARKSLLEDNGYGSLNESTVSRLLLMSKHETAIRIWRDTLTQNKRDSWNSPTTICNRCPTLRAAIADAAKSKPPRQPRKSNTMLAVEHALDTLSDYLQTVEDEDARAALIERVVGTAKGAREEQESHVAWVAALAEQPYEARAEALYQLLLEFDLSLSHLDDAHEAHKAELEKEMAKPPKPKRSKRKAHAKDVPDMVIEFRGEKS
jgi:hypothetical protein